MQVNIRPYQAGDEQGMYTAHVQALKEVCSKDYPVESIEYWSDTRFPEMYAKSMEKHGEKFHVLEVDGQVVGFSGWAKEGIEGFYLHPSYIGKGLAAKLFEVTEKDFWENSGQQVCRIESTITAKPFYERMGFEVIKPDTYTFKDGKTTIDVWKLEKVKPNV